MAEENQVKSNAILNNEEIPNNSKKELLGLVSDVQSVQNVQSVMTIHDNIDILDKDNLVRGGGIFEKILAFLYKKSDGFTYSQLSKELGISYDSVSKTIERKIKYFQELNKEDGKKVFALSDLGNFEIESRIKEKSETSQKLSESVNRIKAVSQIEQEIKGAIRLTLQTIRPKKEGRYFCFDFQDIASENPGLSDQLLSNPEEVLTKMQEELEPLSCLDVRIVNLPKSQTYSIESVRAKELGKLIALEGRVVSLSSVRPLIVEIKFECPSCGTIISVIQNETKIKEPTRCSCGRRGNFRVVNKILENSASVVLADLQEKTDSPNNQRITCRLLGDDLTSQKSMSELSPGNEIKVVGIPKEVYISAGLGQTKTSLGLFFEIISFEMIRPELDINLFEEEKIRELRNIGKIVDEKGIEEISESLCPEVYGKTEEKKALILMAVSPKNEPGKKKTRNKPNILFIGDPAGSKSILAKSIAGVTPQSRICSGGGSSAVGITASVVKEDESLGGYRAEPGAMVLAKEILDIEELNNLNDEDKPKLQEGMSEQSITINKANLHLNLKVTCGILATANPIKGNFEDNIPIVQQFNIPSPILNRFDIVFTFKDNKDEETDKKIAEIMLKRERQLITSKYNKQILGEYIAYCKSLPEPTINEEISQKIIETYARARGKQRELTLNPRFLESFIRFLKASARLRLSTEVNSLDILRVKEIFSASQYELIIEEGEKP